MKIDNQEQLRELYPEPTGRARIKVLTELDKHCIHFLENSPFAVMSTVGAGGKLDASPRGGAPGFTKVLNNRTIVFPDAKGNNRLDSLTNIVDTGEVGLLFLIPGIDETLRLNGRVHLSTDPELMSLFTEERIPPKTCVVVEIEEVFLHCAKAFMRSKLWSEDHKLQRTEFPTMGQMLKDQTGATGEPESQEAMVERYRKDL